jgi:hypothetical protein
VFRKFNVRLVDEEARSLRTNQVSINSSDVSKELIKTLLIHQGVDKKYSEWSMHKPQLCQDVSDQLIRRLSMEVGEGHLTIFEDKGSCMKLT